MSFTFGFLPETAKDESIPNEKEREDGAASDQRAENSRSAAIRPFRWITNVAELLEDRAQEEIVCDVIPRIVMNGEPLCEDNEEGKVPSLRRVDLQRSSFIEPNADADEAVLIHQTTSTHPDTGVSDLLPTVYEGGLKVWECSLDLVHHLQEHQVCLQPGQSALELGCGHGLPGCCLLQRSLFQLGVWGSSQQKSSSCNDTQHSPCFVTFCDYNDFVLKDATISNLVLNLNSLQQTGTTVDIKQIGRNHVRMAAGDWMGLVGDQDGKNDTTNPENVLEKDGQYYDFILAAETIYTEQAAQDTALLLGRLLKPNTGVGLVATKRYYFGVGGGVDAFTEACCNLQCCHLKVDCLKVYDNGHGNIREILRVVKEDKS